MVAVPSWASSGSALASFLFVLTMVRNYIPNELKSFVSSTFRKMLPFLKPYNHIKLHEYGGDGIRKNEMYSAAEAYLSSACLHRARRLKAELKRKTDKPLVTIDDYEEVTDTFHGATVRWHASKQPLKSNTTFSSNPNIDERRFYRLSFHKRHRELIEIDYLQHILVKGRTIMARSRKRKLFMNNPISGTRRSVWSPVTFEHPATFDTLAMDPERKKEIIDDLVTFREGKKYYKQIGKAWKRGYLLYGPPGTGKSTMIAAIANFLEYDVYDLELTAVTSNTELKRIFLETTGKSIIVIEDIDCSIDLTGKRKDKKNKQKNHKDESEAESLLADKEFDKENNVTLSGLLNFIDGLWSACGGERLVIFTTNHIENLDPALIRRGRMDIHIEMSYCTFEAFKVLAKNYLGIENHHLFDTIRELLLEVKVSSADAAEALMFKSSRRSDVDLFLQTFIEDLLNKSKEEAMKNESVEVKDEDRSRSISLKKKKIHYMKTKMQIN